MPLLRDQILASTDLPKTEVDVPEWGGSVFVRVMSGAERDAFEVAHQLSAKDNVRARLVAFCACDAAGVLLFSPDDVDDLGNTSAAALDRLFAVAVKINRLSKKDVDELQKN